MPGTQENRQQLDPLEALREKLPRWQWRLILTLVFGVSFLLALRFVQPINDFDWRMFSQGVRYMIQVQNPYPVGWVMAEHYEFYYPPWSVLFFAPIATFSPT